MRPVVASGQREGYAAALTGLWKRLSWALTELESIAGDPAELETESEPTARGDALAATILVLSGATVFATGATLQLWPVWALGLALFASGVLVYSPRP